MTRVVPTFSVSPGSTSTIDSDVFIGSRYMMWRLSRVHHDNPPQGERIAAIASHAKIYPSRRPRTLRTRRL